MLLLRAGCVTTDLYSGYRTNSMVFIQFSPYDLACQSLPDKAFLPKPSMGLKFDIEPVWTIGYPSSETGCVCVPWNMPTY